MYSAPSGPGVEYCTHSPACAMTACPAWTSSGPPRVVTRSDPRRTTVNSSNSGVCPGSTQPLGLCMRATLTASVREFTRPMNSSMIFGLFPAAAMTDGFSISVGMRGIIQPPPDGPKHVRALVAGERVTLLDLVHLLQAPAAARGRRMLRDEDRMVPPRRLPPVVARRRGREALADQLLGVAHDFLDSPRLEVRELAAAQAELLPEARAGEAAEDFVERDHWHCS